MLMKTKTIQQLGMHLAELPEIRERIAANNGVLTFDDLLRSIHADKSLPQVQSKRTLGMLMEVVCELA